jgi:hypothetical protein
MHVVTLGAVSWCIWHMPRVHILCSFWESLVQLMQQPHAGAQGLDGMQCCHWPGALK